MVTSEKATIFVVGDSLVAGVGSTSGGWAQRLAEVWTDTSIIGIPGASTSELLVRLGATSSDYLATARTVIVHIGINDSRLRPSKGASEVSLDEFRRNLIRIVKFFPNADKIAFVGLPRVIEELANPYRPDRHYLNCLVSVFDYAIREAAKESDALYIDVPALDAGGMMADGIHPSDEGYLAILYRVLKLLDIG